MNFFELSNIIEAAQRFGFVPSPSKYNHAQNEISSQIIDVAKKIFSDYVLLTKRVFTANESKKIVININNRFITVILLPKDFLLCVYVDFDWINDPPETSNKETSFAVAHSIQSGSLEIVKLMREFFQSISHLRLYVEFSPIESNNGKNRRADVYDKVLKQSGFVLNSDLGSYCYVPAWMSNFNKSAQLLSNVDSPSDYYG